MDTDETPRKHATIQEGTKFALHKLRDVSIMLVLLCQERVQISGNDAVERILFRIAGPVDVSHRDVRMQAAEHPAGRKDSDLQFLPVKNSLNRDKDVAFVPDLATSEATMLIVGEFESDASASSRS
jgi:hypothetical protein